jgi:hypothetical protein
MRKDEPSRSALTLTWVALVISVVLLLWGIVSYGLDPSVNPTFWNDIRARFGGPMTFRFFLQPTMAFIAALPDGIHDAKLGRSGFFWAAWGSPDAKTGRLREGLISTARIMLLGISMDVIYQFRVFDRFFPVEALVMAVLLALIPYFLFRGIIERVARWWLARKGQ